MFQWDSRLPPSPTVPFSCELRFFLFNLQSTGSDHVGKFPIRTGPSTSPFPKRASDHPYFLFSKSFNRNTYGFPRKCCKQKTYGATKLFRCNTSLTRNTGGGCSRLWSSSLATELKPFPFTLLRTLLRRKKINSFVFKRFRTLYRKTQGWGVPISLGPLSLQWRSLRTRRSRPCRNWLGISANAFAFNCRLSTYSGRGRGALLTDRLLARGGDTHGFVHIGVCLLAGISPALVAALEVFKVILQNFFASLAHAFSGGFIQCALCLLLGSSIRVLPELHDRSVGAPVALVLRVAVSLHLLVQRVNQQVVSPQDERNPRDTQNQEPFKHSTEPTPSLRFIVADYSVAQAPRRRNGVHQYLHRAGTHRPQAGRWVARAGNCLTIYWTLYQFYAAEPSCNLMLSQSEVRL